MKQSLYTSLLSRLKNKHTKLATRFHKGVKEGVFQKQHYRKRKDTVERLKSLEKRITCLGSVVGFKPRLNYKHWAVALAMGVVVSAGAQQRSKENFQERLKEQINSDIQPLAQSVFFQPKVGVGYAIFNKFHTGDIDGDGDIDAIYVSYLESPLILTNQGSFSFTTSNLTNQPLQIVDNTILADFDGDGDLDLFMNSGEYGAFIQQIWVNDGNGNFAPQASSFPAIDFDSDNLKTADVDGDGDLDIICEVFASYNYVAVLLNNSSNFTVDTYLQGSYGPSPSSRLVSVLDVDGDTDVDIVYTSYVPSNGEVIQVFDNDGLGNFTDASSYLVPSYSFYNGAVPLDFDNDGDLDVAGILNAPNFIVRPLPNDGTILNDASTNFSEGTDIVLSPDGNNKEDLFPFDINNDNFDDLVATTEDSTFVLISNGSGLFTIQTKLEGQSKPEDLDGDSDGDLFFFDGNVSTRNNQGAGSFAQNADLVTVSATYDIQLVDIDGDGDLDLAQGGGKISRSWLNDGNGNFSVFQEFPGDVYQMAFGDLDGDGDLDMAVAIEGNGNYPGMVLYTNSAGTLTYNSNLADGYEVKQIALADMDEDGDLDIVVRLQGPGDNYIRVYDNLGSMTFGQSSSIIDYYSSQMDLGNIDNDSDLDIVVAAQVYGIFTVINNNGLLAPGSMYTPAGANFYISDVDMADLDGDGDLDVFATNAYESPTTYSYVFLNNGAGSFADSGQDVATGFTYNSFLGDIDGDGDMDIISGGYISYPSLWINDGAGNFAFDHEIPTIVTEYGKARFGDIDGDGSTDVVIGDYYGGTQIFFNTGAANLLEADAIALTSLFDNMGGAQWTNSSNWGSSDVSTWHGVFLNTTADRVERLELPNNGLTGTLPAAIDQLDALDILDLSNNNIDALATDLTAISGASDINLNGNQLDFGDLEAVAGIAVLSYTNQQEIDAINESGPIEIPVGSAQTLTATVAGSANSYQWTYEGQNISGATGNSYEIVDINRANMGAYRINVSNSIASGVTLTSTPVDVLATAIITTNVTDAGDALIAENVNGYLLEIKEGVVGFDTVQLAIRENISSSFSFPAVVLGDFLVNVSSDEALYVPTYFGGSFLWDEADTLKLEGDSTIQIVITETPPVLTPADGDGLVNGTIEEDFEGNAGRIDARRRAASRKCGLRRKRSGGRTGQDSDEFELIAYGETNENGEFEYGFLPQGTYRFFVEYPGIPLDESAFVQFDVGEAGVGDNSFKLAVFASEDGVFIELILGLTSPYFSDFKIYPNPTSNLINFSYEQTKAGKLTIEVFDLFGKEVLRKPLNGKQENVSIDISDFEKGQYIFRVLDETRKNLVIYKIIKN